MAHARFHFLFLFVPLIALALLVCRTECPIHSANYGKLPLSFEVNQGQTAASVKFLARAGGGAATLFFTESEVVMRFTKADVRMSFAGAGPASVSGSDLLPGVTNYL